MGDFHGYSYGWGEIEHIGDGYWFLGYDGNFINHSNVMPGVVFAVLLVGAGLYGVATAKCVQSKPLRNAGLRLAKQVYLACLLFSTYKIAYSAALFLRHPPQ